MSRGARRQLKGLLATCAAAATVVVAACGGSSAAAPAPVPAQTSAQTSAQTPVTVPAKTPVQVPVQAPAPGAAAGARTVAEATCATAPLRARVVSVRQATPDTIRVEVALANLASPQAAPPGSPTALAVEAAIRALDGASVLAADGRRRMFPLRGADGARVGPPADPPPPGGERTFWAVFSGRTGPVSLVLPGCPPLTGLAVTPPGTAVPGGAPSPAPSPAGAPAGEP
jgi:hypothetical protein